jgi:hypothetical protein
VREKMRRAKYTSIPAEYRRAVIQPSQPRKELLTGVISEVWDHVIEVYGSFVAWSSAYADENVDYLDEPTQRREQVSRSLKDLSDYYFPRVVWLDRGTCESIEQFIERSEGMYSEFVDEIRRRGYSRRVKARMAERVSAELGPLKKEAVSDLQEELKNADS